VSHDRTLRWEEGHISPPEDGKAWAFGSTRTTVQTETEHVKSLRGWGGRQGLELARECFEVWRERGHSGYPSGPASFFHKALPKDAIPRANWTVNGTLLPHFHGGWIECYTRGHIPGPLRYYDLNGAYAWAASRPLPRGKLYPWARGEPWFVGVLEVRRADPTAPRYFRAGETAIVTHEDVETYDLAGDMRWAVTWDAEDDVVWRTLQETAEGLPDRAGKLLSQSYWGRWAMSERCRCEMWKRGRLVKSWELPSRELNLVVATMIVHRVIRRVWREARKGCHLVQVDAILTDRKMPTGDALGDWKLSHEVGPEGAFIVGPGRWAEVPVHENPTEWIKHSGLQVSPDAILDPETLELLQEERLLRESFDEWELVIERERARRERLVRKHGRNFERGSLEREEVLQERLQEFDSATNLLRA